MTTPPPPPPAPMRSFRGVPPAIYLALAASLVGAIAITIAALRSSGELYERFQAIERWRVLDLGCDVAGSILLALGLLELARRHVGRPRVLAQAAAWLGLAGLTWIVVQPLIVVLEPGPDTWESLMDWLSRGTGAAFLAAVVLLTLAADAWRRAPLAAAGLVALAGTGYWVPVLGKEIAELVGGDLESRYVYGLVRTVVHAASMLFVVAALAAGGREPAPDPHAAAAGLRRARATLMFRLVAGVVIAMLVVAGRSTDAAKVAALAAPVVAAVTLVVFAVALQRIASARLDGLPRLPLAIGATLTLWWAAIQLGQASVLLDALWDDSGLARVSEALQLFSIAGPIAATLGQALVGTALASFAAHRGDLALRRAATSGTATFLTVTLASIGIPLLATKATSPGGAVAALLFAAVTTIVGLVVLAKLLAQAVAALEDDPGIPPARVV